MVVSKHLTHFCYPIRLVLHQRLNSQAAYPGIPPENSIHTRAISAFAVVPSSQITMIIALKSLTMDSNTLYALYAYFEVVCSRQAYKNIAY